MTEKVVCQIVSDYHTGTLTKGKVYEAWWNEKEPVYSSTGLYYTITNDVGIKGEYYSGYFATLDKFREDNLNKVLD